MRVCIVGATGRVGQWLVRAVLESDDFVLDSAVASGAAGQDVSVAIGAEPFGVTVTRDINEALKREPDVVIDYTHPSVRMKHVMAAIEHSVPAVIGTTGFTAEEMGEVRQPEFVVGLDQHAGDTTSLGADIAGPRALAVRLPGITEAAVEVLFGLPGERLTFRHDAEDTSIFVGGSLVAA